jgi:Coenzyme PQQ synthesis protein D (PqqD)
MSTSDRRLCRTTTHRYRKIGDEGVVVLLERGEVMAVNEVGALLLEHWQEERSLESAVDRIITSYAIDREAANGDVAAFADEMIALGVLDERGGS